MKRILVILFVLISTIASATTYYVKPTGNNSNTGLSDAQAWATWGKAFNATEVQPGDTVFFRGGIYNKTLSETASWYYNSSPTTGGGGYAITRDGTEGNYIYYWGYPADVAAGNPPILDCLDAYTPTNRLNSGIRAGGVNYVHFKDLITQNVNQVPGFGDGTGIGDSEANGWQFAGSNIIFENCTWRYIWGHGLEITGGSSSPGYLYVINCDAHNCVDSLSTYQPGNDGAGFAILGGGRVYLQYCRAWLCGDQGFTGFAIASGDASQYTMYDGCWSFRNGILGGVGYGYKMGAIQYTDGNLKRTFKNCIAAFNRVSGFATFDYVRDYALYCNVYNNTSYRNGWQGWSGGVVPGYGFVIQNVPGATDANEYQRLLRNNVSYNNENGSVQVYPGALYTHDHNNWDIAVTVTDGDFVSVDSTGISGARQADGSLPDLNGFLELMGNSDLINAGIDVGLAFNGSAPDLGYVEYTLADEPSAPYIATTTPYSITANSARTGGYMITDGGGTISAKGVCWSTSATPDLTDNVISGGTGTDDFTVTISGLAIKTLYHVRAYATNEVGTTYGADEDFTTSQSSIIKHAGKIVKR